MLGAHKKNPAALHCRAFEMYLERRKPHINASQLSRVRLLF